MNYYFSSDWHFRHYRMVKERGFGDVDEMDECILDGINKTVSHNDKIYFLGDFTIGGDPEYYRNRIRCKNLVLIFGNHDKQFRKGERWKRWFNEAYDAREIKIGDQYIYLHHYACRVWSKSHYGSFHCFGHSHHSLSDDPHALSMDVGIDGDWGFRPISFDEVKAFMSRKAWKPIDHHEPRD